MGNRVALVSDAGTPLVSDPGYRLAQQGGRGGIPGRSHTWPLGAACRPRRLRPAERCLPLRRLSAGEWTRRSATGSPNSRRSRHSHLLRVPASHCRDRHCWAAQVLGADRRAAVCREWTKTFEEFRRGTLGELAASYDESANVKGEIVLVIGPPEAKPQPEAADVRRLAQGTRPRPADGQGRTEAARRTGLARKELYDRLLHLKDSDEG